MLKLEKKMPPFGLFLGVQTRTSAISGIGDYSGRVLVEAKKYDDS